MAANGKPVCGWRPLRGKAGLPASRLLLIGGGGCRPFLRSPQKRPDRRGRVLLGRERETRSRSTEPLMGQGRLTSQPPTGDHRPNGRNTCFALRRPWAKRSAHLVGAGVFANSAKTRTDSLVRGPRPALCRPLLRGGSRKICGLRKFLGAGREGHSTAAPFGRGKVEHRNYRGYSTSCARAVRGSWNIMFHGASVLLDAHA